MQDMVGLEKVKEHIHNIKAKIETARRQGANIKEERFGTVLLGNPGTGRKRTSLFLAIIP